MRLVNWGVARSLRLGMEAEVEIDQDKSRACEWECWRRTGRTRYTKTVRGITFPVTPYWLTRRGP